MSSVDLFVDVLATGTVLGADALCSPEEVPGFLGETESVAQLYEDSLLADYGGVEFGWQRGPGWTAWESTGFQIENVEWLRPGVVNPRIAARYGDVSSTVMFGGLRAAAQRRGLELVELRSTFNTREFWAPDFGGAVNAMADVPGDEEEPVLDDAYLAEHAFVQSVGASRWGTVEDSLAESAVSVQRSRDPGLVSRVESAADALVGTASAGRAREASSRLRGEADCGAWWTWLLLAVRVRVHDDPARGARWAGLYLDLTRIAGDVGAATELQTACRLAGFAPVLHHRFGLGTMLTSNDVATRCLDAAPLSPEQLAPLVGHRPADIETEHRYWDTMRVVQCALRHQRWITDPEVTERLRSWRTVAAV